MACSTETLRDAFEACDRDWLADAVIQFHSRWRISPPEMGRRRFDAVVHRVSETLHCMEIVAAPDSDRSSRCFIPCRRYLMRGRQLAPTMDYLWLSERKLADFVAALGRAGLDLAAPVSAEHRRTWGVRLLELGDREWSRLAAVAWPVALRGRILGAERLTAFDYHCFLASIFWMMAERAAPLDNVEDMEEIRFEISDALQCGDWEPEAAEEPLSLEGESDSIELFEAAWDRMVRSRARELNALACWDAVAALGADINDFETIEP